MGAKQSTCECRVSRPYGAPVTAYLQDPEIKCAPAVRVLGLLDVGVFTQANSPGHHPVWRVMLVTHRDGGKTDAASQLRRARE